MRVRRVLLVSGLGALCAGFALTAASQEQVQARNDEESRVVRVRRSRSVSASDCNFLRDPESYLGRAGRRQRDVSLTTEQVSAQVHEYALANVDEVPYRNFIDRQIFDRMRRDRIPHSGLISDVQYMRRVTLDLTGRTPTPEEVRSFIADSSADKRDRLVDRLMDSPEYVDRWALFFGDLYKNTDLTANVNRYYEGRNAFHFWLRQALNDRWPYNDIVANLLMANGSNFDPGAANWLAGGVTLMGPIQDTYDALAVSSAKQFLGINQLDCLECHNGAGHLTQLSLWGSQATRMQAWQMSAFFSRTNLQRQAGMGNQPYLVSERTTGNYTLNTNTGNRVNRVATDGVNAVNPKYLFSSATASGSWRASLAQAVTADRQFARATVNYLWAELMGLGIVDPPDSFDVARLDPNKPPPAPWTLQPSNPQLLEELTSDFINSGFDLRRTVRLIVTSSAYQLSSRFPGQWKPEYTDYFARHFVKRLKAEEVHDAILRATGTTASYTLRGFPQPINWAIQLPDVREPNGNPGGASTILDTFLRGNRDNIARSDEVNIQQMLALMNDNNFILTRVRYTNAAGIVRRLITAGRSNSDIVDELYLSALSRLPAPEERTAALNSFRGKTQQVAAEDLLWVLINKVDFLYNY